MLTLAHFNPSVSFPKLKGEYVQLLNTESFKLERIETKFDVYFLGSLHGKGIAGSTCQGGESYPEERKKDNLRSAYTTISRMMSYVVAMVHDTNERLGYLNELIAMTRTLNVMSDYEEPRVAARLVAVPADVKLDPRGPISNNETVIMASEIWHVHPTFSDKTAIGKYEGIDMEVTALWGIEKTRYSITLARGDYRFGTFVDVSFEEHPEAIVNAKLEEFNTIQEFIPFPPESENAEDDICD